MKIGIGLVAALAIAVLPMTSAMAQGKGGDKGGDKAQAAELGKMRERGMKDAPGFVQAKGYPCTVTDAIYMGPSQAADAEGKPIKGQVNEVYEVACSDGLGFIFGNPGIDPLDCLKLSTIISNEKAKGLTKFSVPACRLPGNADPKVGLVPVVKKLGVSCPVDRARWVGVSSSDKFDQYEVGCSDGDAFLVEIPAAGSTHTLAVSNCFQAVSSGNDSCQYYQKSAGIALVSALTAKSGKPCTVSDARWVANKTAGGSYYETACSDGKTGFLIETDKAGAFVRTVDCVRAETIAGGCTLTATSTGETTDAPLYGRKAKEIGFECAVSKYRGLGLEGPGGRENVEVACTDRADGAFLLIPVKGDQKGELYDCVRAEARAQACKLSDKKAAFAKVSQRVSSKGATCNVRASRGIGQTPDGQDVVELACEGGPGIVAVYEKGFQNIAQIIPCAQASGVGGCKIQ